MNTPLERPLERNPGSDPAGGMVEPQAWSTQQIASPTTTAPDRPTRSTLTGDSLHTVSAIYPSRAEAEGVRQHLIERGFAESAVRIIGDASESQMWAGTDETGRDEVLRDVLVDGAIGTAVGTGVGVIGTGRITRGRVKPNQQVSIVARDGTVVSGQQYMGDLHDQVPLLAIKRPGQPFQPFALGETQRVAMNQYTASVAIHDELRLLAMTAPRGNRFFIWDLDSGEVRLDAPLPDCAGVGAVKDGFVVTSGQGRCRYYDCRQDELLAKPLEFSPGQYATLQFTPDHIRPYSMAGLPGDGAARGRRAAPRAQSHGAHPAREGGQAEGAGGDQRAAHPAAA